MSDDIIRKALGMNLATSGEDQNAVTPYTPDQEIVETKNEEIDKDIAFARDNMINLIAQSDEAIAELLVIAKQSQHPRAFEVVANLLKTSADLNNDFVALHKKKQELQPKDQKTTTPRVPGSVQNNLFVGSTAELQRMLIDMNKKNDEQSG